MGVVRSEKLGGLLRPGAAGLLDEPGGVGGSGGEAGIDALEDRGTFADEPPQDRIDEARGSLDSEEPRGVDGRVYGGLWSVAGVLHLMRGDRQQRPDQWGNGLRTRHQELERWRQP